MKSKWDPSVEQSVCGWVTAVLGTPVADVAALQSGVLLGQLVQKLGATVVRINTSPHCLMQRENIQLYLQGRKKAIAILSTNSQPTPIQIRALPDGRIDGATTLAGSNPTQPTQPLTPACLSLGLSADDPFMIRKRR